MMYYKNLDGGYISSISTGFGQTEITEAEYNGILSVIRSAPTAQFGYEYKLRADTLEWELVELPPEPPEPDPEIDGEEALNILLGVGE